MKRVHIVLLLASFLALLVQGCSDQSTPTQIRMPGMKSSTVQTFVAPSLLPQSVVLAGMTVSYAGRSVTNNQTIFTYIVTGPREEYDFRLELPSCAGTLASFKPANGILNDNDEPPSPGIEWSRPRTSAASTRDTFSLTYTGLVREGIVGTAIEPDDAHGVTGLVAGACARVFDISGTVFDDGNQDGILGATETGIVGATVNLLDTNNVVLETFTSDAFGHYTFTSIPNGHYRVAVDTGTVVNTSTKYLGATTPASLSVTGGPDSPGNNFGFHAKSTQLVADLNSGVLPTNGLTPGFWEAQLDAAIRGKGKFVVSKDSLIAYIVRIRGLALPEPFQFGTGDGLQAAHDSMVANDVKHGTDLQKLKLQLIALEFNWVSHHGIQGTDAPLQLVLIGWGEGLVAAANSGGATTLSVKEGVATTMSAVTDASNVFASINKSSGGGGVF